MQLLDWVILIFFLGLSSSPLAQLQLTGDEDPQAVFGGTNSSVCVTVRNPAPQAVVSELSLRIFQASTALALPVESGPWKTLTVLPGQTIVETLKLSLPQVRVPTMRFIQFVENRDQIIGVIKVKVFPHLLLQELKPLFGPNRLGLWDPTGKIKSTLAGAGVPLLNLTEKMEEFIGTLALLVVPTDLSKDELLKLQHTAKTLLKQGITVLCIGSGPFQKPPGSRLAWIQAMPLENGFFVQCPSHFLDRLGEDPVVQQNFIRLIQAALDPKQNPFTVESNPP